MEIRGGDRREAKEDLHVAYNCYSILRRGIKLKNFKLLRIFIWTSNLSFSILFNGTDSRRKMKTNRTTPILPHPI